MPACVDHSSISRRRRAAAPARPVSSDGRRLRPRGIPLLRRALPLPRLPRPVAARLLAAGRAVPRDGAGGRLGPAEVLQPLRVAVCRGGKLHGGGEEGQGETEEGEEGAGCPTRTGRGRKDARTRARRPFRCRHRGTRRSGIPFPGRAPEAGPPPRADPFPRPPARRPTPLPPPQAAQEAEKQGVLPVPRLRRRDGVSGDHGGRSEGAAGARSAGGEGGARRQGSRAETLDTGAGIQARVAGIEQARHAGGAEPGGNARVGVAAEEGAQQGEGFAEHGGEAEGEGGIAGGGGEAGGLSGAADKVRDRTGCEKMWTGLDEVCESCQYTESHSFTPCQSRRMYTTRGPYLI
ncbi:hypothetical protein DFJ74DRAFT_419177 [Hyaloraphidium curvatum]|nr:hypothetical protein DFJ74DRAFT_419177 [Hyaloraphidium curvatum]